VPNPLRSNRRKGYETLVASSREGALNVTTARSSGQGLSSERLRKVGRPEMNSEWPVGGLGRSLEPAPATIITAAAENQYDYDYEQKRRCVHDALLWIRETRELNSAISALKEVQR
jgi:hypothetical protein